MAVTRQNFAGCGELHTDLRTLEQYRGEFQFELRDLPTYG
jgi:hypothetical protein